MLDLDVVAYRGRIKTSHFGGAEKSTKVVPGFVFLLLPNPVQINFGQVKSYAESSDGRVVWSICLLNCRLGFDS